MRRIRAYRCFDPVDGTYLPIEGSNGMIMRITAGCESCAPPGTILFMFEDRETIKVLVKSSQR
jgi:hypothetical protein